MAVVEQIFPSLTWRIRQIAMYPNQTIEAVKLENDFDGIHFGIYEQHELVGVVSLFAENDKAQFRKLAVIPAFQNRGLGLQLMKYLLDFCKLQKIKLLWCNARVNAEGFYEKLNFKQTGLPYEKGGIAYIKLTLDLSANSD